MTCAIDGMLAALPAPGGYVGIAKTLIMFLLLLPWLWAAGWMDKDTQRAHMPHMAWTGALLGAGALGVGVWMLVPVYIAGLGIYIVLTGAVGTAYVIQRNAKVIPEARILTAEHLSSLFRRDPSQSVEINTRLKLYNRDGKPVPPPEEGGIEEKLTYNHIQDLLYEIVWRRASDADITPTGTHSAVRFVIDGVLEKRPPMERAVTERMIDKIKELAGMDTEDRRRPQTGQITADLASQPIDINVAVRGSTTGQRMQLKIVQEAVRTHLEELGMSEDVLRKVQQISDLGKGLILVAARGGNGMTSTLYSLLRANDAYTKELVSIEANPEVDLENITQNVYKSDAEMPRALASALRRDPDVIMVDRCPDAAGAATVLEGAAVKKILLGVKANDSFTALARWAKLTGDIRKAVAPLHAVICQVLVRKLCPACREAYRPDPEMVRKANLPANADAKFYRPPSKPLTDEKGKPVTCATCQGSGYLGRTAAFELLEIGTELRQLIAGGANLTRIKADARKRKMLYLQEQSLRLVLGGVTSIQEVIRVTRTRPKQEKGNP